MTQERNDDLPKAENPTQGFISVPGDHGARESQERHEAARRGRISREQPDASLFSADPELVLHAFAALSDNVRDYAIFLLNADGVIQYWGEGARLMKRWTKAEAEGGHLRMLYVDGGSEDGTAEGHILEAIETGEYVGQGHRVRGDGTTFWAQVTLTALKSVDGKLLGFAKTTRDLTTRHAADAAVALAAKVAEVEALRREGTDWVSEIAVLKEEVAVLQNELAQLTIPTSPPISSVKDPPIELGSATLDYEKPPGQQT
jgi:PAS domain S-box-containing protein